MSINSAETLDNQTPANTRLRAIVETYQRCGSSNLLTHDREFSNGAHHIELRCTAGHFIKFLAQYHHERMPFGCHKGERLKDLPDDYHRWLLERAKIGKSLRRALERLSAQGG